MEDEERTTERALLFPLKAGLFAMKSSTITRSVERIKLKCTPSKSAPETSRLKMRRGSSMSELDKLTAPGVTTDLVRSTTANQQLSASPASLPHSPYLSRLVPSN